jgi:hypothetical protein
MFAGPSLERYSKVVKKFSGSKGIQSGTLWA